MMQMNSRKRIYSKYYVIVMIIRIALTFFNARQDSCQEL